MNAPSPTKNRQQRSLLLAMLASATILLLFQGPLDFMAPASQLASLWATEKISLVSNHRPEQECVIEEYTAWEEWRTCLLRRDLQQNNITFHEYLTDAVDQEGKEAFPWNNSPPGSSILLEFRALERKIGWSINNAMDNLPVSWPVYAVGGDQMLDVVRQLFPTEIAVGKIKLIDLGFNEMSQDQISRVLTDKSMYDHLVGDHWLFFQLDSAICSPQRHKLKYFIDMDYGWWGAPWLWGWDEYPKFCGNGGFSLRQRKFIMEILTEFEMDPITNEDGWFCRRGIDLMRNKTLSRPPAPFWEEQAFSTETILHSKPFGVHATWHFNRPDYQMRGLIEHCPDMLGTIPGHLCNLWPHLLCELKLNRTDWVTGVNTDCDWEICNNPEYPENYPDKEHAAFMHYDIHRR